MAEIYTRIKHSEYKRLIESYEALKKENARLKAELKKAPAKAEVKETKKGGSK